MDKYYLECSCTDAQHIVRFMFDNNKEVPALYVETQLNPNYGFFGRVRRAFLYIFGFKCQWGHWTETVLFPDQVEKLRDLCNNHLEVIK